jgi:TonB family protein
MVSKDVHLGRSDSETLLARIQGDAEITVGVRRDGSVESVSVAKSYAILGQSVLQSAKNSNTSAGDAARWLRRTVSSMH